MEQQSITRNTLSISKPGATIWTCLLAQAKDRFRQAEISVQTNVMLQKAVNILDDHDFEWTPPEDVPVAPMTPFNNTGFMQWR